MQIINKNGTQNGKNLKNDSFNVNIYKYYTSIKYYNFQMILKEIKHISWFFYGLIIDNILLKGAMWCSLLYNYMNVLVWSQLQ